MREWSRRVKYDSASNERTSKEVAAAIAVARLFKAEEWKNGKQKNGTLLLNQSLGMVH